MTAFSDKKRVHWGSRIINASLQTIYQAFVNQEAVVVWRPPVGMTGKIHEYEPRVGGRFRMSLAYTDKTTRGKTSEHEDGVHGRFLELVPNERIVELVEFESAEPRFQGEMTVVTTLTVVPDGTEVIIRCENVPWGISESDHRDGIRSTLNNLARFTERRAP